LFVYYYANKREQLVPERGSISTKSYAVTSTKNKKIVGYKNKHKCSIGESKHISTVHPVLEAVEITNQNEAQYIHRRATTATKIVWKT
jgi:hypothetical protein